MDILSNKIEFKYADLQSNVDDPMEDWQLLLRITARFSIEIGGEMFFDEPDFPVLEFAEQAKKWSSDGDSFAYHSMETDENPMIAFDPVGEGEVSINALDSLFNIDIPLSSKTVQREIKRFISRLGEDVKTKLGINVARII